jgi:hypothetical protein
MLIRIFVLLLVTASFSLYAQDETVIPDSLKKEIESRNAQELMEGITAEQIVEKYVDAIGGVDALMNIQDRTTIMRGTAMGQSLTILVYQKAPNLLKQQIKVGGMSQDIIFNGEKGVMKFAEQKMDITGEELERLKIEASIDVMYNLPKYGIKLNLLGIENINNKPAYKVEFTYASGMKSQKFFDVASSLIVKEFEVLNTAQGSFNRETYLDDYRDSEGVMVPYKITQNMGPQQMEFTVSSVKVNTGIKEEIFKIE